MSRQPSVFTPEEWTDLALKQKRFAGMSFIIGRFPTNPEHQRSLTQGSSGAQICRPSSSVQPASFDGQEAQPSTSQVGNPSRKQIEPPRS